jgi:arylsulfatase A-like enzyme
MPTLLDIAGAPIPPEVEGRSLLPLLRGEDLAPHTVFTEANSRGRSPWELRAVREGDFKLVYNLDLDRAELYNLRLDPEERNDLALEQPQLASTMLGRLQGWMAYTGEVVKLLARSDEQNELDEDTLRALRNAGY